MPQPEDNRLSKGDCLTQGTDYYVFLTFPKQFPYQIHKNIIVHQAFGIKPDGTFSRILHIWAIV
jgi:hypothetical protein